jgi:hypothetical protein
MRVLASERRWDLTTVVEVAVEDLLKSTGHMDSTGRITEATKSRGMDLIKEEGDRT